ncbi:MAG: methyltransferase [Deltaproteobacteria bacterium]|nr:methyltransferase [Deltaproteobacteria bacterium]
MKDKVDKEYLRKVTPISEEYGFERGAPIDRYYIEEFLKKNKSDIKGTVLEIMDREYTVRFGGRRVRNSDVLDVDINNKKATIYADLRDRRALPEEKYDCVILTQTLHFIDDYNSVISNVYGVLKKNGVLLCTVPSVSRIDSYFGEEGDFWRFTKASARYIFQKAFAKDKLHIDAYGNVLADICFLKGLSAEEITKKELDYYDKYFPLLICVRAVK